jgi:hypothetical protein
LDVTALLSQDEKTVSLKVHAYIMRHVGENTVQEIPTPKGRVPTIQQPVFYKLELKTEFETEDGAWHLVSVMSPPGENGKPSSERKWLAFLRATVERKTR